MAAASPQPTIVLLGDSTLDNILWVPTPSSCIACQLRASGFSVLNYAADGFTTDDVLNGGQPLLSRAARERAGDALPGWGAETEESSRVAFEPLKHIEDLARTLGETSSVAITVVLSVGGNDIRHILADLRELEGTVKRLHANYAAVLERLLRLHPVVQTVICMQYCPCVSQEMDQKYYGVYAAMSKLPGPDSATAKLNMLMRRVYAPIVAAAFANGLAVIDLPNTFDANNSHLYTHQIEPSALGGRLISALISHVWASRFGVRHPPSAFYSIPPPNHDIVLTSHEDPKAVANAVQTEANVLGFEWRVC